MNFIPWKMPETLTGAGSVKKLPKWVQEKGFSNVLIVTGKRHTKLGLLNDLQNAMHDAGVKYTIFDNVQPNPTDLNVQEGLALFRVLHRIPCIFAVPTTAGTGSETTIAAVITNAGTHHKASINDTSLMPKYAVLDPELTAGLPPQVTATTGMDALCHAVEAYTNNTYNSKLEKDLAEKP